VVIDHRPALQALLAPEVRGVDQTDASNRILIQPACFTPSEE
jgi:hypothetical protein